MFKNLIDKGKCKAGLHDGEWVYVKEGSCVQTRLCRRCGQTSTRVADHEWDEWAYQAEGECAQIRRCGRCGEEETQVAHTWDDIYVEEGSCETTRGCSRCGQEQTGILATSHQVYRAFKPKHAWTEEDWAYLRPDACAQARTCPRCGEEERRTVHDWSHTDQERWTYVAPDSCATVRTCHRCGETEVRDAPHPWGEWGYVAAYTCAQVRTCPRCGQQDNRVEHDWQPGYAADDADKTEITLRLLVGIARNRKELYEDAISLQSQWRENLENQRRYGDNENLRSQRYRVKRELDRVASRAAAQSFDDLCDLITLRPEAPGRYRVVDAETGLPVDTCSRCGQLRVHEQ